MCPPDASHQPLISPAEVAILESMMEGGVQLSLKAHFLSQLPSLAPVTATLTYLNVSFNDLRVCCSSASPKGVNLTLYPP